jgi:putrescine transport system substrate-binding protein
VKKMLSYLLLIALCCTPLAAQDPTEKAPRPKIEGAQVVNVYGWYEQIPNYLIQAFEEETGIKVNLDIYDSNEVLEAKLLAGNTGYDVVFPTAWPYVVRQAASGLYLEIDKLKLSNYKNLDPLFLEKMQNADPGNLYSIPFTWGLVAIGYDEERINKLVPEDKRNSWALLYDPEVLKALKGCGVTLLEDPLDVFLTYYIYRGENPLDPSLKKLKEMQEELKKIRPYIKRFGTSLVAEQLGNGGLCVVMHWSEVLSRARSKFKRMTGNVSGKGSKMKIILPKEGTLMWIDCVAIPKDALHVDNAHRFIDFLLRAQTAAGITNSVYTATTVKESYPLLKDEIRNNKAVFPGEAYLKKVVLPEVKSLQFQRRMSRSFASLITHKE